MSAFPDGVLNALPPEKRTLLQLATASNANAEIQATAAKEIVEGVDIPALRKFVLAVIQNQFLKA
jgi:hypothetical protein